VAVIVSASHNISSWGAPVPVDSAEVDRALNVLWSSTAQQGGGGAVMRACSCNIVVVAQNPSEAALLPPVIARIAEWHPSRSVITFNEGPEDLAEYKGAPHMHAWVSAQCSAPEAGRPQVCSEAIVLAAQSEAARELPSAILSLLVPDLPVFVYWRSFNPAHEELVDRLIDFAGVLIVDSHASKQDPVNRERLLKLLHALRGRTAVRDLNWSRLTPWRDMIAQFFDPASMRGHVYDICEVEIRRAIEFPGSIPTRTLLLTGWLASRLGWKRESADRTGDEWISKWRSPRGEVVVRFTGSLAGSSEDAGISSITLKTRAGVMFSVSKDKACDWLTATIANPAPEASQCVPYDPTDEASLLTAELSIAGQDPSFERALAEALTLERLSD
jgi:glucose-6-phosphate dehydrogenase assembly protein OpcA